MEKEELIKMLRRNMVETGGLICLGCGHEHNCSTEGCAVMREAAAALETRTDQLATMERTAWKYRENRDYYAGQCTGQKTKIEAYQSDLARVTAEKADLRNELCQQCGKYRMAHKGACDGCRWRTGREERGDEPN